MSKRKITVFSVLIPLVVLAVVAIRIALASGPTRPGSHSRSLSVAARFAAFSKTFGPPTDTLRNDALVKLRTILASTQRVPGIKPDNTANNNLGPIGCKGAVCLLKLGFTSVAALENFASDYDALKNYYDWSGPKFTIALSPNGSASEGTRGLSTTAVTPQLLIGMGSIGSAAPPSTKRQNTARWVAPTTCKWSDDATPTSHHSYQLSASACSGYLSSSFPGSPPLDQNGVGQPHQVWESLHMHAFMPVTVGSTTVSLPMTQNSDANGRGVLVCPVPYETNKADLDHTDVPTKVCATVALLTGDNQPTCRIRWIASQGDDASNVNIERFSAAKSPAGATTGVKVTSVIVDGVDPTWYQFFNIDPDTEMTELSGMDVLCAGMQPDDRVVRYRFDYEFASIEP